MTGTDPARILVVDDELGMREFLQICLSRAGHHVTTAASGGEAIRILGDARQDGFDLVLTDLSMPGVDGMEVLRHCSSAPGGPIVLMMTAFGTADTAVEAMKAGAHDYLLKPFKVDEIQLVVERALAARSMQSENQRLREQLRSIHSLDRMVGRSASMLRVFELVRKIAPTRTNVLIRGESGTGKELVARALHKLSGRPAEAFIPVNCGAIPAALMESELFGHKKGAFTGATSDRPGMFVAANGGTLFLDEVGELDLQTQVKLLRALQERKVRPVGATQEVEVDCRVVAATNRDLSAAIAAKEFREDLYFRLNVVQIMIPPLRRRPEDITPLVERFFERYNREMSANLKRVSREAHEWFLNYDYPGNVRELENLVERAVALESGSELSCEHLPAHGRQPPPASSRPGAMPESGVDLDAELQDLERELISAALERCDGVRRDAAQLLRISERSLRYRMAKLGLSGG